MNIVWIKLRLDDKSSCKYFYVVIVLVTEGYTLVRVRTSVFKRRVIAACF